MYDCMKGILLMTVLLITLGRCSTSQDQSAIIEKPVDQNKRLYNDILNELVTRHFYNLYLGEQAVEDLDLKYSIHATDTARYNSEIGKLRQRVEADTSQQKFICISNELRYGPYRLLRNFNADSVQFFSWIKSITANLSNNFHAIADSVNTAQVRYKARDFRAPTFKISRQFRNCEIGVVSFSKVFLDKLGEHGVLYYEFVCGAKCGKGEILIIEYIKDKWIINEHHRIWIM